MYGNRSPASWERGALLGAALRRGEVLGTPDWPRVKLVFLVPVSLSSALTPASAHHSATTDSKRFNTSCSRFSMLICPLS
jgi:hypothetical protein